MRLSEIKKIFGITPATEMSVFIDIFFSCQIDNSHNLSIRLNRERKLVSYEFKQEYKKAHIPMPENFTGLFKIYYVNGIFFMKPSITVRTMASKNYTAPMGKFGVYPLIRMAN